MPIFRGYRSLCGQHNKYGDYKRCSADERNHSHQDRSIYWSLRNSTRRWLKYSCDSNPEATGHKRQFVHFLYKSEYAEVSGPGLEWPDLAGSRLPHCNMTFIGPLWRTQPPVDDREYKPWLIGWTRPNIDVLHGWCSYHRHEPRTFAANDNTNAF